jgi:hypothetical protein
MSSFKNAGEPKEATQTKKRYQRPEIVYQEPLEAMAAVCTPAPPAKADPGTCPQGPIAS